MTVPAPIVITTMRTFEKHYNANVAAKSAFTAYATDCDVTVNDGTVFAGKSSHSVANFLGTLRNQLGGTNIKFSTTKLEGNVHEDVWVADNGAGSCVATWAQAGGAWKIVKDVIAFTPRHSVANAGGVPTDVVIQTMKEFEDNYNANQTSKSAAAYAANCDVTVNNGSVFAGKTPEECAGFLNTLRNTLGGTNIKFATTKVEGNMHEDIWVADNGAGSCKATWAEVDGQWKIVKDEISFTPKLAGGAPVPKLHAFPVSQPSRSVMMLLDEAGVDHDFMNVNILAGESRTPEFLKMNPAGFVPVLEEADFIVTEGGAILTYLAQSRGLTDWYPEDPKVQAAVDKWMMWNHTGMRKSTIDGVRPSLTGGTPDLVGIKQALEFIDARLGESGPFLAGTSKPTIADLFVLPEVDQLVLFNVMELSAYPKVVAWMKAMEGAVKAYAGNAEVVRGIAKSLGK